MIVGFVNLLVIWSVVLVFWILLYDSFLLWSCWVEVMDNDIGIMDW